MKENVQEKLNKKYMNIIRLCIIKNEYFYDYLKYINIKDIDDKFIENLIEDTKNNYILHYINCSEVAILKTSVIGKILESGDFDIDINTGNILLTAETKEMQKKEYQKIWIGKHKDYYKNYNKWNIINTINKIEHNFFNKLQTMRIHGICFSCGETTFFTDSHHILGRKNNDIELSICPKCHYKYRGKLHCINIGNKIERLFT